MTPSGPGLFNPPTAMPPVIWMIGENLLQISANSITRATFVAGSFSTIGESFSDVLVDHFVAPVAINQPSFNTSVVSPLALFAFNVWPAFALHTTIKCGIGPNMPPGFCPGAVIVGAKIISTSEVKSIACGLSIY